MKIINMQCPNCGGKLKKVKDDLLECESCQSQFLIKDEAPDYYIANNFYTHSAPPKTKPRRLWITALVLIFIGVTGILATYLMKDSAHVQEAVLAERDRPESAAGIALAERIFHKPLDQITTDELAQVKYLSIDQHSDTKNWLISYSLSPWGKDTADYETRALAIDGSNDFEKLDFTAFKGLQFLDLTNTSDFEASEEAFSLAGLKDLLYYGHDFNQSLDEIIAGLPNPKQLKYLRTQIRSNAQIESLAELTGLQGLAVTYLAEEADISLLKDQQQLKALELSAFEQDDLAWLASMPKLQQVTIQNADDIADYSVFYGMPQLIQLSLQGAAQLKDLNFVQNLPNLKSLEITESGILTLEPLRGKETLGKVKLEENYALSDVTALASLANLSELTLSRSADNLATASLSELPFLKRATLYVKYLEIVANAGAVQSLEIRTFNALDLAEAARIPNVENLTIYGSSSDLENEISLQQMNNLKHLALYGTKTVYSANAESCIFRLPQLTSLVLGKDTVVKVNLDTGYQLDGLTQFELKDSPSLRVIKGGTEYASDEEGMDVLAEALSQSPNLKELYLPSSKLSSVEFARSLNQLQLLDVQDNYISDVSPLVELSQLQEVNLIKNPVANQDLLPDSVYIVE